MWFDGHAGQTAGAPEGGLQAGEVLQVFEPYRKQIDTVAVESTYNWYWLVDGLMGRGYKVALANPAQIDQYDGLKHTDQNFFLPSMKLVKKWREGSRWVRRHDKPKTAYQRLMAHPDLSGKARRQLRERYEALDPFVLAREVERRLKPILSAAMAG